MSKNDLSTSGAADRYATALFELCDTKKSLKLIEQEIQFLQEAITGSKDLASFINSPIYSREQHKTVLVELCGVMKLSKALTNTILLMASKRRLSEVEHMFERFRFLVMEARNEILVEVVSSEKLSKVKLDKLSQELEKCLKREVLLQGTVDTSLLGGLIVKIGSKMLDTSIKAKLDKLKKQMKEVA